MDSIPFQAIAEFTYDWESWLDRDGRVRWVNPAIERITGYTVDEALRMADYPLSLVAPEDHELMQSVLERALAGESGNHVEFRVLRKDGKRRWTAISWQPFVDSSGVERGVRTSVRDIDERKWLETELKAALEQAEAANRAKLEFLANVSHELRTPLVSIRGYAELLRVEIQHPEHARYVATLSSQGRQLERLVSDLLDFSTLSSGSLPLHPAPVHAGAVVREAALGLAPRAREKGLRLVVTTAADPPVSLDAGRLTQVVTNLLDNAIKYTERGQVEVSAEYAAEEERFFLRVRDSGPGLPEGLDPFQPFQQGESSRGGVGLGLSIAHRLCSAMGGELRLDPESGPGARFLATFYAPLAKEPKSAPHHESGAQPASVTADEAPLRVLVVDDVASAREFLRDALRSFGYEAAIASSGAEALHRARAEPPDVAFIDLRMPGRSGWAVARELRRLLGPASLLVGSSASGVVADNLGLALAGFDAFLPKPVSLSALEGILKSAARRKHAAPPGSKPSYAAPSAPDAEVPPALKAETPAPRGDTVPARLATLPPAVIERLAIELPELCARLREKRAATGDLVRAVHDLGGICALLGETQGRALAIELEERLLATEVEEDEIERLLTIAEALQSSATPLAKKQ